MRVQERKINVLPEIMIPLVGTAKELAVLVDLNQCDDRSGDESQEVSGKVDILYGTMIEVPRAGSDGRRMAADAEFFSFGTNDLTQMTFGYSRDDVNSFLPDYLKKEILERDPFQTLDDSAAWAN